MKGQVVMIDFLVATFLFLSVAFVSNYFISLYECPSSSKYLLADDLISLLQNSSDISDEDYNKLASKHDVNFCFILRLENGTTVSRYCDSIPHRYLSVERVFDTHGDLVSMEVYIW